MNGGHPEDGRSGGRQPPPNKGSSPDLLGALPSGRYPLFVSRFIDVNGFGAGKFGFSPGRTRSGKTSPVFPRSGRKRENLPAAPSPTPRRNPRAAGNRRPRPAVETGGSAAGGTGDAAGRRPFGAPRAAAGWEDRPHLARHRRGQRPPGRGPDRARRPGTRAAPRLRPTTRPVPDPHRVGNRPDLESRSMNAEERWNEAAAYAVVAALVPQRIPGFHIGRDGLRNEDIGNGCWGMSWIEGGRAVFYGYDADHNELAQHVPPVDLLAGAPDWLPWEWLDEVLRTLLLVSCVEWWDGTAWSRAPLPEGVSSGEGDWFGGAAVEQCYLDLADPDREEEAAEAFDALREAALRRAVDRSVVEPLADALDREVQQDEEWEPDIAGALATAERLGVAPGSTRPELPAGRGEPADRRVVSACPPQDLVSRVM